MRVTLTLLLSLVCYPVLADHGISLEAKVGNAIDASNNISRGFQVQYENTLYKVFRYYIGWGYSIFNYDHQNSNESYDIEQTGYSFGIKSMQNFLSIDTSLYAGITYKHYEHELDSIDLMEDSGHDLGYELGFIMAIPINQSWDVYGKLGYEYSSNELSIASCCNIEFGSEVITSIGTRFNF